MRQMCIVAVLVLASMSVTAQPGTPMDREPGYVTYTSHEVNATPHSDTSLYKRKSEWRQIVDQFWGPGLLRYQKQQVFDTFANYIHDIFPGFGGLNINWDSLRTFYAQQITDSTSRGGFSLILSRLSHDMHDLHVMGWDTIMQTTPLNPGVPIFALSLNMGDVRHFGAVLTPLPDSSLLVVRSVAGHPLNLQPGDIVVGYEGVPWKHLAFELLDSPLPQMGPMGSSESARIHLLLVSAGVNWHLFDTIDVIRHQSGALEHLPTTPLSSLNIAEYMPNNEQLPVASVPQPDYEPIDGANTVSYGIVEGTNIGYIYISGHLPGTRNAFGNAVAALMETDGLIIDIRWNSGGYVKEGPEAGLALLMNHSTQTLLGLERATPADLYTLKPLAPSWLQAFSFDADPNSLYDRPIAVLIGPFAISQGDLTAYKFRFLPGARFFGRSVHGAASGFVRYEPVVSGFRFVVPFFVLADHREPNVALLRKEFPLDEPVWLDRDDVALGDDTVVKRALGWITSVAHAHDVAASCRWLNAGTDTVRLTAVVENPNAHPLTVTAVFGDTAAVDSSAFADDGMHGDGAAGDGVWGLEWVPPAGERFWNVRVTTRDMADRTVFSIPYAARLTTAGPVTCAGYSIISTDTVPNPGNRLVFKITLKNNGSAVTIPAVTAGVTALDSGNIAAVTVQQYGDISPGAEALPTTGLIIQFSSTHPGMYVAQFAVDVSSMGMQYWRDTVRVVVTGIEGEEIALPTQFSLSQNYPNPFNPSTTIRYGLPSRAHVMLTVFNTLGQHMATLVQGEQEAGYHEVQFDASWLASGVYLYRLQAGSFVETRKLVLIR